MLRTRLDKLEAISNTAAVRHEDKTTTTFSLKEISNVVDADTQLTGNAACYR